MNPDVTKIPQVWDLFTGVCKSITTPASGNVTLLFCDDNVGDLRRLPRPRDKT